MQLGEARVVITNYHAYRLREEDGSNPTNRALRQGRGPALDTRETEGKMVQRVMKNLMGFKTDHGLQ